MNTEKEERTELIILWSGPWWVYMLLRGGFLRAVVNTIEDILAITGRTLLLVFLIYCGIKSGALLVTPDWHAPDWLEMLMFALQLAGLEGSIPGLARHAQALRANRDEESAKKAEGVMHAARWMTILSIGEGVLHLIGMDPMLLKWISGILLLARGVVITGFLIELAKLDAKGPRILSQQEHDQECETEAQQSEQAHTIVDLERALTETQAALVAEQQQGDQTATLLEMFRRELQRVESGLPQVVQGVVHSQMNLLISEMQQVFHSEVQRVVHAQLQLVQLEVQQVVHSLPETIHHQVEQVVHVEVQPLITEQVQRLVHLIENDAHIESLHELAERVQQVSIQVSELGKATREALTPAPTKAESEPLSAGSREPLRLVQSKAKRAMSEPASERENEPVELRVKRFILAQREQRSEPSLSDIVNQCKCSKNSAIRYRRELDEQQEPRDMENIAVGD